MITVTVKAILATALTTVVLSHVATAGAPPDDPKFEKFKREMLPQVGRKVTAVGKLDAGKLGWWLSSQEWGFYLYTTTTNRADLETMNRLGKFRGHQVKVVGTLRHGRHRDSASPLVSAIPEHFYFDVTEVVVSDEEPAPDKATTPPMTNAPVLKVDDAHWMSQPQPGQKAADPYTIPPSTSITLDATGYRFDPAKELRDKPLNSIQIIQKKTHQFEITWETNKTRYELSSATLRAKPGSQPFTGFAAGDKVVIAIGVFEPPTKFFPVWFSIIEVK